MRVYRSSIKFPRHAKKPVLALGNFDGVHLAHQKMFRLARASAKKLGGIAVAYTFDPHPVRVLSKDSAPPMLNTLPQKLELLQACGLDAAVIEPFDLNFAHSKAEAWLEKVLLKRLHPHGVVVGYDFTFGSHRSGTVETLEHFCKKHDIQCQVLEAQMCGETLISSTRIRNFLSRGDVARAAELLGRPYFIDGIVIRGAGRGASLGIPTANLRSANELIPISGVYATWAQVGKKRYKSVTNIGFNPTFGGETLSIETHLLHFKKEFYGKTIRLHFVKRIRDERSFPSVKQLLTQIHRDILTAEKIFLG